MKPLVVGQSPSKTTVGQPALSGQTGKRLAELAGITHAELLQRVEPVNIMGAWQGRAKSGKGDMAQIKEMREAAKAIAIEGRRVLCLGRAVARSFGAKAQLKYFAQFTASNPTGTTPTAWLFPHTSGISRHWNNPANKAAASEWIKEWLAAGE